MIAAAVALGLFILVVVRAAGTQPGSLTLPYSGFVRQVQGRNVASVTTHGFSIAGQLRQAIRVKGQNNNQPSRIFRTQRPAFASDGVLLTLERQGATVNATATGSSPFVTILLSLMWPALLLLMFFFIFRRSRGMQGGLLGTESSHARRYDGGSTRTTFADVAGIDEVTDQLAEIVDILRDPDRYRRLGARIPRGVMLCGPPGTGKTLVARAVAGEADVPFFSIAASEFVEKFVGVGAGRVRDLFQHAKQEAPAIVFIDELDAVGRRRGGGAMSGANDEREQTLNQILTEMDGFTGNEGVIVLAATNRPEILDPALLRAGRFDRRIVVNPPDLEGRRRILEVHTRSVPLEDDVDLGVIASSTPGMVGADLANLVNEAALDAARRGSARVCSSDISAALERIVLGATRKLVLTEEERRLTAYHESGHALLGMLQPGADPVRKVSIIPRGQALGVTFQSPATDRHGYAEPYLRGRLVGLLGGRAAEQLVFGEVTTGAESDLEQATALARQMVGRWGMSRAVGLVTALPADPEGGLFSGPTLSERTLRLIDSEVSRLIEECYREALRILEAHRPQLDRLASTLLQRETLDEADAYAAAGVPGSQPRTVGRPVAAA
ncbi:MAG TPA: ATP-dependent zinc metalloprotease FtsH [Solirubrobacteraceae bacterium]|nr:ATP-dependent zinc metalloprotease FtsH [Solirubrobacteraceae bacterium]